MKKNLKKDFDKLITELDEYKNLPDKQKVILHGMYLDYQWGKLTTLGFLMDALTLIKTHAIRQDLNP